MSKIYLKIDTNKIEDKEFVLSIKKFQNILIKKLQSNHFYRFQEIIHPIITSQKINHTEYNWLTKLVLNGALNWTENRVDSGFKQWCNFMLILKNKGLLFDEKR